MDWWWEHWVSGLFGSYLALTAVGLAAVMAFHWARTRKQRDRLNGYLPVSGGWILSLGLFLVYVSPVIIAVLTIALLRRH